MNTRDAHPASYESAKTGGLGASLDLALAETLLRRGRYHDLGVIGSQTKRQRFDYLLEGKGINEEGRASMHCPIGLPDVKGKLPAEIAVAVAGEIIAVY